MKDSESSGVRLSGKKAKTNGRSASNRSSSGSSLKSNGTKAPEEKTKRIKTTKAMMGGTASKTSRSPNSHSKPATNNRNGEKKKDTSSPGRKNKKESPELRPRRRASQTYFFKYQLANNPLKAEEDDLKLALLASLESCSNGTSDDTDKTNFDGKSKNCKILGKKSKSNKDDSTQAQSRRPVGRPPKGSCGSPDAFDKLNSTLKSNKKSKFLTPSKKGQQFKICANSNNGNGDSKKRRGSVESSSSSKGSSLRDDEKRLNKSKKSRKDDLSSDCALQNSKTTKPRSKLKNSLSNCNDLTSVQNKIKKAKKLLQDKQANKNKGNAIISKYSALRKFPSNSSKPAKRRGSSLLNHTNHVDNKSKSKSKLSDCYFNDPSAANSNTTSKSQYLMPYSPYTPLQKKEPPGEDYLKKYKPETEDFLFFICFRTTAPNYQNRIDSSATNGVDDANCIASAANAPTSTITGDSIAGNSRIMDKQLSIDSNNLKQFTSSLNNQYNRATNTNMSPINVEQLSPNNHRRPTRQSPRLASSHRKISENDILNHNMGTITTAYDNSITYEEDMKRASIALEDMAQEISSDGIINEIAQHSPDCISKASSSPFKNNKHLVKGLMTREFAGAFADEETIFESISNHKL